MLQRLKRNALLCILCLLRYTILRSQNNFTHCLCWVYPPPKYCVLQLFGWLWWNVKACLHSAWIKDWMIQWPRSLTSLDRLFGAVSKLERATGTHPYLDVIHTNTDFTVISRFKEYREFRNYQKLRDYPTRKAASVNRLYVHENQTWINILQVNCKH